MPLGHFLPVGQDHPGIREVRRLKFNKSDVNGLWLGIPCFLQHFRDSFGDLALLFGCASFQPSDMYVRHLSPLLRNCGRRVYPESFGLKTGSSAEPAPGGNQRLC